MLSDGPSFYAFNERHGGMVSEIRPESLVVSSQAIGRHPRRVPTNFSETSLLERVFVSRDAQMVVLDVEGSVAQMKGPLDGHTLLPLTLHTRLKPVLAIRPGVEKSQGGIAVHRDESSSRLQAAGNPIAHGLKFMTVSGIIQQIRSD